MFGLSGTRLPASSGTSAQRVARSPLGVTLWAVNLVAWVLVERYGYPVGGLCCGARPMLRSGSGARHQRAPRPGESCPPRRPPTARRPAGHQPAEDADQQYLFSRWHHCNRCQVVIVLAASRSPDRHCPAAGFRHRGQCSSLGAKGLSWNPYTSPQSQSCAGNR